MSWRGRCWSDDQSETPRKLKPLVDQAHQVADEVLRPISRKYDTAEHERPKELDMLAALIDGMNDGGGTGGAGRHRGRRRECRRSPRSDSANRNGSNLATVLSVIEMCWGDVGLLLALPGQGLGNSAIASVADEVQSQLYAGRWAAMAITEPEAGSDSAAIRTTAVREGDEYVLNGEKIYVTAGERAELVVVWASLDRDKGRAAIKSFVVERSNPGLVLERLEHKLGIRASDTAAFRLEDCRVPKTALLGDPEIVEKGGFAGVMQTFDNTRPLVAAMAVGVARACLEETHARSSRRAWRSTATGRRSPRRPAPHATSRSKPTTRPHACSPSRPPGWPTTGAPTRSRPRWPRQKRGVRGSMSRWAASSCAAAPDTARRSCWRNGRATRRSSTSSRAPSRSSC